MEIWVPYGDVESLFTIQAENLAELLDQAAETHVDEIAGALVNKVKGADEIIVLDRKPATLKVLKATIAGITGGGGEETAGAATSAAGGGAATEPKELPKIVSPWARPLEVAIPELKGAISKLEPPSQVVDAEKPVKMSPQVCQKEVRKIAISTGEPDPLFGFIDSRVALALATIDGARGMAYASGGGPRPHPPVPDDKADVPVGPPAPRNEAYESISTLLRSIESIRYETIVTRGGQACSMVEQESAGGSGSPSESFSQSIPSPAKGLVVGAGGTGYDETLSHAIRLASAALGAVRKGGEIILVAECRDGIGSEALQMFLTGRVTESALKKGRYVDGLEEVELATRLKEQYSVTVLSSLPELYLTGKLRFRTARGAREALNRVFASLGRTSKLNVVTRACELAVR